MEIITVQQAEQIILSEPGNFGTEHINYEQSLGRVLAENLYADRDLPPFNRATVDGIAIDIAALESGTTAFNIKGTQAAGEQPLPISTTGECIEIMTGAALHESVNTVIRYEDLEINQTVARLKEIVSHEVQNIHKKGRDKQAGDLVVQADQTISAGLLGIAASLGAVQLAVKKLPRVMILTTGDELVPTGSLPNPFQIRQSNGITIRSVLSTYQIVPDDKHLSDNYEQIEATLAYCLREYDVLLVTGGVSMGKFDFIPQALAKLGVRKKFHKIKQRPGKPFWFGTFEKVATVFAFPGNPVSVFMCLHRYFIPWLQASLGLSTTPAHYAILQNDIHFPASLQYFAQVRVKTSAQGQLLAESVDTNGSGDFSHLGETNAFIELPLERTHFRRGEVYRIWKYNVY